MVITGQVVVPPAVRPPAIIGIVAPASPVREASLAAGRRYLEARGFETVVSGGITARQHHLAGDANRRRREIEAMFAEESVAAVFAARGGYGSLQLLAGLDYALLARRPKFLLGYSDLTALQLALWQRCRLQSLSGPLVAVEMARGGAEINEALLWGLLGRQPAGELQKLMSPYLGGEGIAVTRPGRVTGRLLGGTLSVMASLAGTGYLPDFAGRIIIFEERGERLYRLDRYLTQLRLAGVFSRPAMVVCGDFSLPDDEEQALLPSFLADFFAADDFPVVRGFAYGHCRRSFIFVQGGYYEFDLPAATIRLLPEDGVPAAQLTTENQQPTTTKRD
ncbi:MAG: LD-carboxypeptidase [Deltaproteobacteria bacterium]|nr:LD-carboxypeptidase [Deltaproteobacteria bacterium]